MSKHFEPDRTDDRHRDDIDKRCIHCGWAGTDHYNGQCPEDERPDDQDFFDALEEVIKEDPSVGTFTIIEDEKE